MRRLSRDQIGLDGCLISINCSIVIGEAARGWAARGATVAEESATRRISGIVDVRRMGDLPETPPNYIRREIRGEDTAARAARDVKNVNARTIARLARGPSSRPNTHPGNRTATGDSWRADPRPARMK